MALALVRDNVVNLFALLSGLFSSFSESERHQNEGRHGYDK